MHKNVRCRYPPAAKSARPPIILGKAYRALLLNSKEPLWRAGIVISQGGLTYFKATAATFSSGTLLIGPDSNGPE